MSACLMSSKVQVTSWCNHLRSDEHAINMHPRNKDHPESSWNHRDQQRFRNQICYLLIRFDLQIYTLRCSPLTVNIGEVVGIPGGHLYCECIPRWQPILLMLEPAVTITGGLLIPISYIRDHEKFQGATFCQCYFPEVKSCDSKRKRKESSSKHQCSGAMIVSGKVGGCCSL